jgi:hypothetical protein
MLRDVNQKRTSPPNKTQDYSAGSQHVKHGFGLPDDLLTPDSGISFRSKAAQFQMNASALRD